MRESCLVSHPLYGKLLLPKVNLKAYHFAQSPNLPPLFIPLRVRGLSQVSEEWAFHSNHLRGPTGPRLPACFLPHNMVCGLMAPHCIRWQIHPPPYPPTARPAGLRFVHTASCDSMAITARQSKQPTCYVPYGMLYHYSVSASEGLVSLFNK